MTTRVVLADGNAFDIAPSLRNPVLSDVNDA